MVRRSMRYGNITSLPSEFVRDPHEVRVAQFNSKFVP